MMMSYRVQKRLMFLSIDYYYYHNYYYNKFLFFVFISIHIRHYLYLY